MPLQRTISAAVFAMLLGGGAARGTRPPVVDRMLAFEAQQMRGVVGYRSTLTSATKMFFGPAIQTEVRVGYISVDGKAVEAQLYSATANGRPLTGALRARLEDGVQRDVRTSLRSPLRLRDAFEYRYSVAASCSDCAAGQVRIHFTAAVLDAQHLNGDVWIDSGTGRPVRMSSIPARVPSMVVASSTVSTFGATSTGSWPLVQQANHTKVKQFFITADSSSTALFTGYRRFASIAEARAALAKGL